MVEAKILHWDTKSKQKLWEWVVDNVTDIYESPLKLHPHFQKIHSTSLEICIRQSTTPLQQWIARIAHQVKASESLFAHASAAH
jgi:trimethylamine:corrinoid methyltransferase-like protein